MISLQAASMVVLYLIIGALVFGLLYFAVTKAGQVIGPGSEPFIKVGQIIVIILGVFCCIGILLSLVSGRPLFVP